MMSSTSSPEVITGSRHDMNFVEGFIVQDGGTCLSPVEISLRSFQSAAKSAQPFFNGFCLEMRETT